MAEQDRTVVGTWRGGYRCEVVTGEFTVDVDEPSSVGGTDTAPQPTELLLASVASCFTLAIAYAAKRRSVELGGVTVEVTGTYDGPRFSAIAIRAAVGCEQAKVAELLALAERVCYVTNTLRSPVEISVEAAPLSG